MTKFLDKKFSVYSGSGEKYRDNWDAIFKKSVTEAAELIASKTEPVVTTGDYYEAVARGFLWNIVGRVLDLAKLLRTVADEARREERAACEAVCRDVASEHYSMSAARVCADRIAALGKGAR